MSRCRCLGEENIRLVNVWKSFTGRYAGRLEGRRDRGTLVSRWVRREWINGMGVDK